MWTLEENSAGKGGIPLDLHSAIVPRYKAEFDLNIAAKEELASRLFSGKSRSKNTTVLFGRRPKIK